MATIPTNVIAAWQKRADRLAQWAVLRLVNRDDLWIRYLPAAKRAKVSDGRLALARQAPLPAKRGKLKLNEKSLARHFRGKGPCDLVGVHSVSETNTAKWIAIDMEAHEGPDDARAHLAAIHHWQDALRAAGFYPILLDCDGEGGYQLLVLLRQPVPAAVAHQFARILVNDYATLGLSRPPRILPAGPTFDENDWLRVPGRHPVTEHWSRAWKMRRWVEGADAAEALLHAHGDTINLMQKFEAAFTERGGALPEGNHAPLPPPPILSSTLSLPDGAVPATGIALSAPAKNNANDNGKPHKLANRDTAATEAEVLCYLLAAIRGDREVGVFALFAQNQTNQNTFNLPLHRTVFNAITQLHERQERMTPTCISEEVSLELRPAALELLDRLLLQKPPDSETFEALLAEMSRSSTPASDPAIAQSSNDRSSLSTTDDSSHPSSIATDDPELAAIIEAWPRLSSTVRQELISLAKQAETPVTT